MKRKVGRSRVITAEIKDPVLKEKAKTEAKEEPTEFCGPLGVLGILLFSHFVLYYFWLCVRFNKGHPIYPTSLDNLDVFFSDLFGKLLFAMPTVKSVTMYSVFMIMHIFIALVIPGFKTKGYPIAHLGNKQLEYNCNALQSWYITLALLGYLHYRGIFLITEIADNFGPLMTTAIIIGNSLSIFLYLGAIITKSGYRMTGNHLYDFFMGATLNPRFFSLDLKMWAEIRISWILLFLLTLSAAFKQYAIYGVVSSPMLVMVLAHFLYANACVKGEECVPTTWDIFHEKFGWMLCFWNFAGVPFLYCFQSYYILHNGIHEPSRYFIIALFVILLTAYYIWDTTNSQKNRFRMMEHGTYRKRWTFPQLPYGTLHNPTYIQTKQGNKLLTGGWWGVARKLHYAADLTMALTWGLTCGFDSFLPYFYFSFFLSHLVHRVYRDMEKCSKKYGADWDRYCTQVPYIFIPGII